MCRKKTGFDFTNPVSHLKLNWMKITLRGNRMMIREINKRQRQALFNALQQNCNTWLNFLIKKFIR